MVNRLSTFALFVLAVLSVYFGLYYVVLDIEYKSISHAIPPPNASDCDDDWSAIFGRRVVA